MNLLRKLIREAIESVVLNEAAVPISEILKNANIGLIDGSSRAQVQLDLYDFSANRVLGTIGASHVADNIFHVTGVAAEKGYGPLMYEFAMMSIYDNGLTPTRSADIRGSAWEIWKQFYNRSDVDKFPISENSRAYSEEFDPGYYENEGEEIIGNTAFVLAPSSEFKGLLERTLVLMKIKRMDKDEIRRKGGDYFSYKYADS
jgi:hypothetical protein